MKEKKIEKSGRETNANDNAIDQVLGKRVKSKVSIRFGLFPFINSHHRLYHTTEYWWNILILALLAVFPIAEGRKQFDIKT